jgi:hypothetical protein
MTFGTHRTQLYPVPSHASLLTFKCLFVLSCTIKHSDNNGPLCCIALASLLGHSSSWPHSGLPIGGLEAPKNLVVWLVWFVKSLCHATWCKGRSTWQSDSVGISPFQVSTLTCNSAFSAPKSGDVLMHLAAFCRIIHRRDYPFVVHEHVACGWNSAFTRMWIACPAPNAVLLFSSFFPLGSIFCAFASLSLTLLCNLLPSSSIEYLSIN